MMSATSLRVLGRFWEACGKTILNGTLRAKRPVNPLRFSQNQNSKSALQFRIVCGKSPSEALRAKRPVNSLRLTQNPDSKSTLQLTKTFLSKPSLCRANFVSEPLSVIFRGRLYSSLYRQIRLGAVNRTGRNYFSYVAFSFVGITLAENGKSSPSPQITKHPDFHWDFSNSFKKHKKAEAEVTQDFENDTAHRAKPLIAKKSNGATFATTGQRRSSDGKAVLPKYSEEVCENKEPKPTESQEEEKPSFHSGDTTSEDVLNPATNFAIWNAVITPHLTLAICEQEAIIFKFSVSDREALERSCAGREFLDVLIKREIINEYDVTNLQKGLSILHQDKLNQDFVEPYQKSIGDDRYKLHKVEEFMTWEDVDKIRKNEKKYAAMGQRNNSQLKRGALCGNRSQREASALQANVVEDNRGNLSSPSVCGHSVLTTSCNDCVSSNILEKTKDAQRRSKSGVKVLLKSVGKSLKCFQINPKQTVKSATGNFKSRLKSRVNSLFK